MKTASSYLGAGALACGLAVGRAARWAILALLVYVCLGVNTAMEASIFTTVGGGSGMAVLNLFTAVGLGGALALLFRPAGQPEPWRGAAAVPGTPAALHA